MTDELVRRSRTLAYVLRHHPEEVGLTLDAGGWVEVDVLLAALVAHGHALTPDDLRRLAAPTSGKRRFELHEGRVRAAQGHSVAVDLGLEPIAPPPRLFHGTATRFLDRILAVGLRPMSRHHVHLSADRETATAVGARHGRVVVLTVDAAALHADGGTFYRATNGVWLVDAVPPRYLADDAAEPPHRDAAVP